MSDRRGRCSALAMMTAVMASIPVTAKALPTVGTASSWGSNGSGQLGDGTTIPTSTPGTVNGLTNVAAIAAGGPPVGAVGGHTLALRKDGSVWSWGQNNFGQLGDGCIIAMTCADRATPAPVPGLGGVVAIAAGRGHSLARLADGRIMAWGRNDSGQLGNGLMTSSSIPQLVQPAAFFLGSRAMAAGGRHSLAVLKDGRILAWGENSFGQLGDGTTIDRAFPTLVAAAPLTGYTGVAGGANHSLARYKDGRVYAWGRNHQGQLGNGTFTDSAVPVQVPGLTDIIGVAAGDAHSVALRVSRKVRAWGGNVFGQLGNGSAAANSNVPVSVLTLNRVVAVTAGANHNLAVNLDGTLRAWGYNGSGQLGVPAPVFVPIPIAVAAVSAVTTAAAGYGHSIVASAPGTMMSWGEGAWGGYGTNVLSRSVAGQAIDATWITGLASGLAHTIAVTANGLVLAMGNNQDGQLGDNGSNFDGTPFTPLPVLVRQTPSTFLRNIVAVSAFAGTNLAVNDKGDVWAWGRNSNGQVGDGTIGGAKFLPVKVTGLMDAKAVAAGSEHSLALLKDGTVRAWGHNGFGQLGSGGAPVNFPTPQVVAGLTNVIAIAAGDAHSLAVKDDGTVWAWGSSANGQLGDGCLLSASCVDAFVPQQVGWISDAVAIGAGYTWSMALDKNGRVWTWGWNALGQLGNGCTLGVNCDDSSVPAPIPTLHDVTTIAAGGMHAAAVDDTGRVWTWGYNHNGQLGNGCALGVNCVDSSVPAAVLTVFGGVGQVALSAGHMHTAVAFPAVP